MALPPRSPGRSWPERLVQIFERVSPADSDYLAVTDGKMSGETWAYLAGTSGTVNVPAGGRVLQITAMAPTGGGPCAIAINGGTTIPVPLGASLTIQPRGNLVAPSIVFTATAAYFVEYVA